MIDDTHEDTVFVIFECLTLDCLVDMADPDTIYCVPEDPLGPRTRPASESTCASWGVNINPALPATSPWTPNFPEFYNLLYMLL